MMQVDTAQLYASYEADLPTGPTVVCAFALALVLAYALRQLLHRAPPEPQPGIE
jgi:hypothetical protein